VELQLEGRTEIMGEDVVEAAAIIASAALRKALSTVGMATWGPYSAAVSVRWPGVEEPFGVWIGDGTKQWDSEWGEAEEFEAVARWKCGKALEHGMPTSLIVLLHPHLLVKGDYFWPGGVVDATGTIGVGVSGVKGWADEFIAYTVLHAIEMLCLLIKDALAAQGVTQLGVEPE
jgi:hypothetical protein